MTTEYQQHRVERVTAGLLKFAGSFGRGPFTDVYAWIDEARNWSRLNIALVGNPLGVSAAFGMLAEGGESRVSASMIDRALRSALDVEESGFEHVRGPVSLPDLLDRIGAQTVYAMDDGIEPFTEADLTFIAEPGFPWGDDDKPIRYWSAKHRAWITPKRPAWLIDVEDRDERGKTQLGVNPCVIFAPDKKYTPPDANAPVFGRVFSGRANGVTMMVAHSMDLERRADLDATIAGIRSCGGMLFPSLSVGPIPASNFGPICLVGTLDLVLRNLKPYRTRGSRDAWVYDTDSWTVNTRDSMGWVARRLFEELHGHEDWAYGNHMWILGPPGEFHGGPRGEQTPVETVSALANSLKRRMKPWHEGMTMEEMIATDARLGGTDEKYAYCEAKSRDVVPMSEFPYLIAPHEMKPVVDRFVKGVGYEGEVILAKGEAAWRMLSSTHAPQRDYALFRWAWRVAEIVHGLRDVAVVKT